MMSIMIATHWDKLFINQHYNAQENFLKITKIFGVICQKPYKQCDSPELTKPLCFKICF